METIINEEIIEVASDITTLSEGILQDSSINILLLFIIAFQIVQLFVLIRGAQNGSN